MHAEIVAVLQQSGYIVCILKTAVPHDITEQRLLLGCRLVTTTPLTVIRISCAVVANGAACKVPQRSADGCKEGGSQLLRKLAGHTGPRYLRVLENIGSRGLARQGPAGPINVAVPWGGVLPLDLSASPASRLRGFFPVSTVRSGTASLQQIKILKLYAARWGDRELKKSPQAKARPAAGRVSAVLVSLNVCNGQL